MRHKALEELGHKEAPCGILPKDTPVERLKAYTIIDNNGFGKWDWDMLANQWDTAQLEDWGMDLWQMEEDMLDKKEKEAQEDDFNEEQETITCRCKRGDVWQLGNHRIMCGDSTQSTDVQRLIKQELCPMAAPI